MVRRHFPFDRPSIAPSEVETRSVATDTQTVTTVTLTFTVTQNGTNADPTAALDLIEPALRAMYGGGPHHD